MMFLYGYNSEGIRMTLTPEVDSTDVYRNLVIEGLFKDIELIIPNNKYFIQAKTSRQSSILFCVNKD